MIATLRDDQFCSGGIRQFFMTDTEGIVVFSSFPPTFSRGNYKIGLRHGKGSEFYIDGTRFEGYFKDGNRHGKGSEFYLDGNQIEGYFEDGNRVGKATLIYPNGVRHEVEIKDGEMP